MAKLKLQQADPATARQVSRWLESIGEARQEELAEMIDAAEDRWSRHEWGAICDWVERHGGRRSYATWLVADEGFPEPPPLVLNGGELNEIGWLPCRDASAMLKALPEGASGLRARRLFACACARRLWGMLAHEWRDAVRFAERYADRQVTQREMLASVPAAAPSNHAEFIAAVALVSSQRLMRSSLVLLAHHMAAALADGEERPHKLSYRAGLASCADVVREVFNPFRVRSSGPSWLTPTAIGIADEAYRTITPDGLIDPVRVLVLADALEEAGAKAEVVSHLRTGLPHFRGCHVVDTCRQGLK